MHVSCSPEQAHVDQLLSLKLSKVKVMFILGVLQKMIALERESLDIFLDYKKMKI